MDYIHYQSQPGIDGIGHQSLFFLQAGGSNAAPTQARPGQKGSIV